MLPLWIIDITQASERQTHFNQLIGKLNGVVMQNELQEFISNADSEGVYVHKKQWYYSHIDSTFSGIDKEDSQLMAEAVYQFQENVVREGQNFVKMLRHANVEASTTLNVCIIADVTEQLTQLVFPSMAVMLQKEKERILPNHIHQGMSIVGMPYMPSNVNNLSTHLRQSILLTIKEIEIQHNITAVRGYDRMFYYQDVQNRTENFYPQLTPRGIAEYLYQCLVHLYYACDKVHPLINGGSSDERFYFSLGVSSVFFDTEAQDRIDNRKVSNDIIEQFKAKGEHEEEVAWDNLIDFSAISPQKIVDQFSHLEFDLSSLKLDAPNPHPIANFFHRKLKRFYFERYLRYYPANLRLKQIEVITNESERAMKEITSIRKHMQSDIEELMMPYAIRKQIVECDTKTGGLQQITTNLKNLKIKLGKMKAQVKQQIDQDIWHQLTNENVPNYLLDHFEAYHDSYLTDGTHRNSNLCQEMKESALADFINILKQETTFASRISHSFLLGITLALTLTPIINMVLLWTRSYAALIAGGLFLLPILIQLISLLIYNHNRGLKKRKLTAYFLHDAYARINNRIKNEMDCLYDNFIKLCDEYLDRCKKIETEIRPQGYDDIYSEIEIPITQFNQPIIGGNFCDTGIIPYEEDGCTEIYVNRIPRKINQLDNEDKCILIRKYNQTLMELFHDIRIPKKDDRKYDETLGYEVFISEQEMAEKKSEMWNCAKENFKQLLSEEIQKDTLPRRNPTIGEKLRAHANKHEKWNLMEPTIKMAATNGELTCSADQELADVKSNLHLIQPLLDPFLPKHTTQFQFDEHKALFEKYLFTTRWRTFDNIALNRVLPTEDFDPKAMELRVNEDEREHLTNQPSSFILWAMCKEDNSKEWLKLFKATAFNEAINKRNIYRQRLNIKD